MVAHDLREGLGSIGQKGPGEGLRLAATRKLLSLLGAGFRVMCALSVTLKSHWFPRMNLDGIRLCKVCLDWSFPQGGHFHSRGPDLVEHLPCMCEALDSICRTVVGRERGRGEGGVLCDETSVIARGSPKNH